MKTKHSKTSDYGMLKDTLYYNSKLRAVMTLIESLVFLFLQNLALLVIMREPKLL